MKKGKISWRQRLRPVSEKPKAELTPKTSGLPSIGYRLFGGYPARVFPLSDSINVNLRRAGIRTSHEVYISSMFFWATISLLTSFIITLIIT